jgi:hypothetical protein
MTSRRHRRRARRLAREVARCWAWAGPTSGDASLRTWCLGKLLERLPRALLVAAWKMWRDDGEWARLARMWVGA